MIEGMAQLHMTEAELARDLHAVLEKPSPIPGQ